MCLDQLVLKGGFTQSAADTFLKVYDATVGYAGLADSDMEPKGADETADDQSNPPAPKFAVGDWVSVVAAGQLIYERTRVRAIDPPWVFVEASQSGAKMDDVTLLERGPKLAEQAPSLPFGGREEVAKPGEEMDRFTVDEGVVKIVFPSGMTTDSVEELEQFFQLFIKKAKRRARRSVARVLCGAEVAPLPS